MDIGQETYTMENVLNEDLTSSETSSSSHSHNCGHAHSPTLSTTSCETSTLEDTTNIVGDEKQDKKHRKLQDREIELQKTKSVSRQEYDLHSSHNGNIENHRLKDNLSNSINFEKQMNLPQAALSQDDTVECTSKSIMIKLMNKEVELEKKERQIKLREQIMHAKLQDIKTKEAKVKQKFNLLEQEMHLMSKYLRSVEDQVLQTRDLVLNAMHKVTMNTIKQTDSEEARFRLMETFLEKMSKSTRRLESIYDDMTRKKVALQRKTSGITPTTGNKIVQPSFQKPLKTFPKSNLNQLQCVPVKEKENQKEMTRYFSGQCTDCGRKSFDKNLFTCKPRGLCANPDCEAFLCKTCKNRNVLIPYNEEEGAKDWSTEKLERFCKKCFEDKCNIDFDRKTEIYQPSNPDDFSGITIVFTHGAGGTRAVYRTHAIIFASEYNHRVILVDLPGHGSRWDEQCTLDGCLNAIHEALIEHDIRPLKEQPYKGQRGTFLAASSWGGYINYYALGKLKEYFSGGISDGSTVDMEKLSMKMKWSCLSQVVTTVPAYRQLSFIRSRWAKMSKGNFVGFHETKFATGVYSQANPYQSIKDHNFWDWIPLIECPCLFIAGTKDSDGYCPKTQKKIISMLKKRDESCEHIIENGHHMLTNDGLYIDTYIKSINKFVWNVV